MRGEERREAILSYLKRSSSPVKGGELSKLYNVSRQVIVQDIALLRAEGHDIIATPQGYVLMVNNNQFIKKIIAVKHDENQIEEELRTIVSLGGRVLDVTIEHKIYGEITGKLMLRSIYDVEMFINKLRESNAKPLSNLTEGVHIHTIEADSERDMERILKALQEKGFLIE
ncbi:MAG: transcription repressor NadR [Caloramator sp.]|nr:transcription repressor NadR [Caloramator sp.]